MNELLGWYGYERLELRRWAASRARDTNSPEQAAEQKNKGMEDPDYVPLCTMF